MPRSDTRLMANAPDSSDFLTTMVNYWPELPDWSSLTEAQAKKAMSIRHRRRSTPIYKLEEVCLHLSAQNVLLATRKCQRDVTEQLNWDTGDVFNALRLARPSDYINSQWCEFKPASWLPCDAYEIPRCKVWDGDTADVYVKFGLKNGSLIMVVSCHFPR